MTTTRVRAVAAGSLAALVLVPLAGCGSQSSAKPASGAPAASATTSSDDASPSSSPTPAPAVKGDALTADNFAEAVTAAIADKKSAHMTMDMGQTLHAEGDVKYADGGSEMKMTMGTGSQEATMIFTGGVLYMQMPGMTEPGKWTKVTKDDPMLGKMVDQMGAMSPTGSVEIMKKGLEDVTYEGKEQVDGERLNHYRVSVDVKKVADSLGGLGGTASKDNLPESLAYDLYVDNDNLMRRVVMDAMGQKLVMNVSDWGKPVDIQAPPAGEVVEMPSMSAGG